METISTLRSAKNNLSRKLFSENSESCAAFDAIINKLISETPTGDLRNLYTELNITHNAAVESAMQLYKLNSI